MRMTTKLVSLLTILFVFFKFGEPAKVMMSIHGDKGFYFDSKSLKATSDIVGFVYEDANGAFTFTTCNDTTATTNFTLQNDCTVVLASAVTVTTSVASGTVAAAETGALKLQTATGFPASGVNTNMMVAALDDTPVVATTTTTLETKGTSLITIAKVVGTTTSPTPNADASKFLCNNLDETTTEEFLTADGSTFGEVISVAITGFPSIMKCVGAVRTVVTEGVSSDSGFAAFILIVTDATDTTGGLGLLGFRSVVLLPQTINQPANATVVGYINGIDKCLTGNNVTFAPASASATSCKGTISIGTSGNYSFSYNGTKYYLPVTDASGATTCPATSTTTCEDFAFNFKYSNTLIGMLLIFMLKLLQSY